MKTYKLNDNQKAKLKYLVLSMPLMFMFQNCEQTASLVVTPSSAASVGGPDSIINIQQPSPVATPAPVVVGGNTVPAITDATAAPSATSGGNVGSVPVVGNEQPAIAIAAIDGSANTLVDEGLTTQLQVVARAIDQGSLECRELQSQKVVLSLAIKSGNSIATLKVDKDLICSATGLNLNQNKSVYASKALQVNCGNKIKNGGSCQDFSCKTVKEISINEINDVPARTYEGICYAVKLGNQIASGPSSLTKDIDKEVYSRSHDGGNANRYSYRMGGFVGEFKLAGERVVKIAGGTSATAPILVDNFILSGVYPSGADISDVQKFYRIRGTSDSSVIDMKTNKMTDYVLFRNQPIKVEPFATGGTSTIAPIDITANVKANQWYTLDIRAMDCGGTRRMSDIYLLFQ